MSPLQYIDVSKASAWPGQNIWKGAKATAPSIAAPVTKLLNMSISTGCFTNNVDTI